MFSLPYDARTIYDDNTMSDLYFKYFNELSLIEDIRKKNLYCNEIQSLVKQLSVYKENIIVQNEFTLGTESTLTGSIVRAAAEFLKSLLIWIKNTAWKIYRNTKVFLGVHSGISKKAARIIKNLNNMKDPVPTPENKEKFQNIQVTDIDYESNKLFTYLNFFKKNVENLKPRDASTAVKDARQDEEIEASYYPTLIKEQLDKLKPRQNLNPFNEYTREKVAKFASNIINLYDYLYTAGPDILKNYDEITRISRMSEIEFQKTRILRPSDKSKLQIYKVKLLLYNRGVDLCTEELNKLLRMYSFIENTQPEKSGNTNTNNRPQQQNT